MMNSQGRPAVLPRRPFWSTTFARDLRWGGVWFVREVIILGFVLRKRKKANKKGLDVIAPLPHPLMLSFAPPYKPHVTQPQQTPEAEVLGSMRSLPFCTFSRRRTHIPAHDCVSRRAELGISPEARPSYALGTEGNKD